MKIILLYEDLAGTALEQGAKVTQLLKIESKDRIGEAKFTRDHEILLKELQEQMEKEFAKLR